MEMNPLLQACYPPRYSGKLLAYGSSFRMSELIESAAMPSRKGSVNAKFGFDLA